MKRPKYMKPSIGKIIVHIVKYRRLLGVASSRLAIDSHLAKVDKLHETRPWWQRRVSRVLPLILVEYAIDGYPKEVALEAYCALAFPHQKECPKPCPIPRMGEG